MVKIFLWIYYITMALTIIYGLYFVVISFFGMLKKNKIKFKESKTFHHFAILIAARNEEIVIGNLISSLNNQNYDKNKFDIYVIPNNCTDNTASVAKQNGAKVLNCEIKTKTKGDVLKFAFDKLKDNKEIDAYVIFDADNVVHPDFLKNMNNCLASGYRIAEGYRDAKNASDNWISGCYNIYYMMQNSYFYRARMGLNGSASINGTGFMIKKDYIDEYGFNTKTLTEDIEFTGLCALNGEKIAYVKDAITYDEYPTLFKSSWKQRKRWSSGMINCMKLYSFKLFKNAIKNKNFPSLDMSLIYLGPVIQIISFIMMILAFSFRITNIELQDLFSFIFLSGLPSFIVSILLTLLIEVIALYYERQKISSMISGILLFPIFMFTWLFINIVCIFKGSTNWEEIKHTKDIKIEDRLK